jgi:ribonuclease HI
MPVAKDHPHWKRMRFKRNKVWMAVDAQQRPLLEKGKVLIKYQLDQPHEYWVRPAGIQSLTATRPPVQPAAPAKARTVHPPKPQVSKEECQGAVCVFTDGACSGNPGPAGIGVVLSYKGHHKEISRNIGVATNNIAELEAIRAGLLAVKDRKRPVIVFTDSNYAFGLLSRGWKAKQNRELVEAIRSLAETFQSLRFVKVKGHAGHPENERADRLAVAAVASGI